MWLSASVLAFALADLVRTATVAAGSQGRLNCRVSRADGCVDFVLFAFRVASFAASLRNVQRVDVLPFHQLGKYKWERLKLRYALEGVAAPAADETMRAVEIFRARGLNAY